MNLQGPTLRAVLETNPSALRQAAELDLERKLIGPRGPLHGIPILLKDNIATLHSEGECPPSISAVDGAHTYVCSGLNTTAGALLRSHLAIYCTWLTMDLLQARSHFSDQWSRAMLTLQPSFAKLARSFWEKQTFRSGRTSVATFLPGSPDVEGRRRVHTCPSATRRARAPGAALERRSA